MGLLRPPGGADLPEPRGGRLAAEGRRPAGPRRPPDWAAMTTLITGASSGLGAEMARQLADRDEDLALCARRTDRLEELRSELLADRPGLRVEVRALDVDDHDAVFAVVRDFASSLGRLDRVVVNAGIGRGA